MASRSRRCDTGNESAKFANDTTFLLIGDEVITGFGRTGKWFAIDHFGVEPDIMTMAKALTAGYMPMGAVITRPEIADAMPVFRHMHTFSGHAGAASAANAAIEIKEREVWLRIRELRRVFSAPRSMNK